MNPMVKSILCILVRNRKTFFEPTCNARTCTSTSLPTRTLFTRCKRDCRVTQTDVSTQDVKDKRASSHPLNVTAGWMGLLESHQWTFSAGIQRF